MIVEAPAKINLTLEVFGVRADGYHALRSVVCPITLADTLSIEPTADGSVVTDTGYGENDLIVRAARLLGVGVRVSVAKRIPVGGGMGGGSADAAATLLALNELYQLKKTPEELAALGASVGSDVPALVLAQATGRAVLMEGRGERVRLLEAEPETPGAWLVLANPGVESSTAEVYRFCTPRTEDAADYLSAGNDLEEPAVRLHPEIGAAKCSLSSLGAAAVAMTGSGSTVFGFLPTEEKARAVALALADGGYEAWVAQFYTQQTKGQQS